VTEKKFIRLTDEVRDDAHAARAIRAGTTVAPTSAATRRRRACDVYVIDLVTGRARWRFDALNWQPSPDGTKALYYDDGNYHVYDLATKSSRNLTVGAPTSFVDSEDDHNVDRPPVQPLGWASDNQHVLLFDNWDVWKAPVRGGALVNLTGNGKASRMRYTRRLVVNPKEKGIDLARPMYLQTYGEWSKKEGLSVS
jgi:hypothetical protein